MTEERQQITDYQQTLDDARERLNKGEISERELQEMKADLKAEMPDAVRQKLEREKPEAAERKPDGPAFAIPSNMDALMRQTGLGSPSM